MSVREPGSIEMPRAPPAGGQRRRRSAPSRASSCRGRWARGGDHGMSSRRPQGGLARPAPGVNRPAHLDRLGASGRASCAVDPGSGWVRGNAGRATAPLGRPITGTGSARRAAAMSTAPDGGPPVTLSAALGSVFTGAPLPIWRGAFGDVDRLAGRRQRRQQPCRRSGDLVARAQQHMLRPAGAAQRLDRRRGPHTFERCMPGTGPGAARASSGCCGCARRGPCGRRRCRTAAPEQRRADVTRDLVGDRLARRRPCGRPSPGGSRARRIRVLDHRHGVRARSSRAARLPRRP